MAMTALRNELPENVDERRMFAHNIETFGSPLRAVEAALVIWHRLAPEGGSYREQLAIMANEVEKAQAEIERLRLIVQKVQRSQFGRRAERLDDDQLQLGFEDLNADIAQVEGTLPATAKTSRSKTEPAKPAGASAPRGHAARS